MTYPKMLWLILIELYRGHLKIILKSLRSHDLWSYAFQTSGWPGIAYGFLSAFFKKNIFKYDAYSWITLRNILIFKFYLQNRKMNIRHEGLTSTERDLSGGSPQGGLLSLILFCLYTNFSGILDKNNPGEGTPLKTTILINVKLPQC